ncbi:MAG: glycosyltransferase family 4 protein [Chitinispirillaceae bacterium]|nr:glycosyltransferase family 4 protein [Chitinispirillaceae bacterium]
MRIGFISGEYPPETGFGGIGTYTKHCAEYLGGKGHRVTIFSRSIDSSESVIFQHGVTIVRIPPRPYPLPRFRAAYPLRQWCTRQFPHTLNRLSWSLAVAAALKMILKTTPRFDIVEAPECGAEGLFISCRMARRRIVRMHTPWEMIRELDRIKEPWGDRIALPLIERIAAAKAEGRTAPSFAIAKEIRHRWHLHAPEVIRNPLPVAAYNRSSGKEWIYTGRIERRKGVHHLISAYTACCARSGRTPPPLTLIGRAYGSNPDGTDYGDSIRSMIGRIDTGSAVRWIEGASLTEVAEHLRNSAVAFFPSLWENFPYTCLEAMACGCIVVASRCGGFPEIITHDRNGILVDTDSSAAIEAVMIRLVERPESCDRLGPAARSYVEQHLTPEIAGARMEQFYRELLER